MTETHEFNPSWASPPGDTILDLLSERNLSLSDFSDHLDDASVCIGGLLNGEVVIDNRIAKRLATFFKTSKAFWINRDIHYRENLVPSGLHTEAVEPREWLKGFPITDMIKFGWIIADRTFASRYTSCLNFFSVSSIGDWELNNSDSISPAYFKTSETYQDELKSTAAWLRYGSICSDRINCASWDVDRLRDSIPLLLALTQKKCFTSVVKEIRKICASCGLVVLIARTPRSCHASGATFFNSDGKAVLLLSCRFRSDDHFWFTFLHEVGHLLLHEQQTFIKRNDDSGDRYEEEANLFAQETLIPKPSESEFFQLIRPGKEIHNARRVMKFAKKIGISPGIVVGQLQHQQVISHRRLNKLKQRFDQGDIRKEEISI